MCVSNGGKSALCCTPVSGVRVDRLPTCVVIQFLDNFISINILCRSVRLSFKVCLRAFGVYDWVVCSSSQPFWNVLQLVYWCLAICLVLFCTLLLCERYSFCLMMSEYLMSTGYWTNVDFDSVAHWNCCFFSQCEMCIGQFGLNWTGLGSSGLLKLAFSECEMCVGQCGVNWTGFGFSGSLKLAFFGVWNVYRPVWAELNWIWIQCLLGVGIVSDVIVIGSSICCVPPFTYRSIN